MFEPNLISRDACPVTSGPLWVKVIVAQFLFQKRFPEKKLNRVVAPPTIRNLNEVVCENAKDEW